MRPSVRWNGRDQGHHSFNLADTNYRLEPLNYYLELPRGRTFFVRVKLTF